MLRLIAPLAIALACIAGTAAAEQVDVDTACQAFGAERGEAITLGSGASANLCWFEDARACTLEALQGGDCIEGGYRTTGYMTRAARYCAWLGGEVSMAEEVMEGMEEIEGICDLPDGSRCVIARLYYGTCD